MAASPTKQRTLQYVLNAVGKGSKQEPEPRPVLEQFVYALCREGTIRENADRAFRNLQERFFDWNEVRVSSVREIADALEDLVPDPEARAQRLIDFLQEVFETTFSFDLEALVKRGLKQAAKQLARYHGANDYAVAWVVQQSLGGHAIPLDAPALRVLRRLGLLEEAGPDLEALRASVEHQVPKAKGHQFVDLISRVAEEFCWETDPACPTCPLLSACPTGQEAKAAAVPAASKKPR